MVFRISLPCWCMLSMFTGQAAFYLEVHHYWVHYNSSTPQHGASHPGSLITALSPAMGPNCNRALQKQCSHMKASSKNQTSGRKHILEETRNRSRLKGAKSHLADGRSKGPGSFLGEAAELLYILYIYAESTWTCYLKGQYVRPHHNQQKRKSVTAPKASMF